MSVHLHLAWLVYPLTNTQQLMLVLIAFTSWGPAPPTVLPFPLRPQMSISLASGAPSTPPRPCLCVFATGLTSAATSVCACTTQKRLAKAGVLGREGRHLGSRSGTDCLCPSPSVACLPFAVCRSPAQHSAVCLPCMASCLYTCWF